MAPKTVKPQHSPFRQARRAGVPIVCYETADPAATIVNCIKALNGAHETTPFLVWDFVSGLRGMNDPGRHVASSAPEQTTFEGNPSGLLKWIAACPPRYQTSEGKEVFGILFFHNGQRFLDSIDVLQATWNCRDPLKAAGATVVFLSPSFHLPAELCRDVVIISEPLPGANELAEILDTICENAEIEKPKDETRKRMLDTLLGLGAFEAEQVLALSATKEGIDQVSLWDRKVKAIEATPGLTVYKGHEKFSDVGGLENGKLIAGKTISGKSNISCLVFADELDKSVSAYGSDTSGTTQDQVKGMLCYMQDEEILGMLWLGPPGTGKTALAKALAGEYGIPLIMLDLGALKGSLVGQSEQNMRQALKVIHAVSDGRALFIGACNRTDGIPPELRRRFSYASIFFDLPDRDELDSIWKVWKAKYGLSKAQCDNVRDDGWAGSEVRNCCLKSWAMDCKLSEAAQTIVPVSKSAADVVQALRQSASGKYISASKPGVYNANMTPATPIAGRKIEH